MIRGALPPFGVRRAKGFTLIELLVIVVIIGILATIAIIRFSNTKEKATDAAAKSDLRNAMTAQEAYFATNQTYTSPSNLAFTTSTGVSLGGGGSASGYTMSAKHAASSKTYSIVVGSGSSADGRIQ